MFRLDLTCKPSYYIERNAENDHNTILKAQKCTPASPVLLQEWYVMDNGQWIKMISQQWTITIHSLSTFCKL